MWRWKWVSQLDNAMHLIILIPAEDGWVSQLDNAMHLIILIPAEDGWVLMGAYAHVQTRKWE
jgi:hypothetical protein